MANQSRDWHRLEGSRNQGRGPQSYRDFDEDNRHRRGSGQWDEDSNGPRSAEGIGDYGGYSEEGRYGAGSARRSEQFINEWRDRDDRGGSYFGTDGGPDFGRAYDSGGAGRFGRGGYGEGDYGVGDYEQSRYGQGEQGSYAQRRYGQGGESGYGRGGYGRGGYGQERYGSDDYGGGRRDFGGRSGGQRSYGSERWGGGDYGSQGGSSFAYGRGGENWGGEGYAGRGYGSASFGSQQWERQVSHRGKGPKGYERSDDRLKEMICERLSDDPNIDASEITVAVSGGVVKLTGTIDSRAEKYQVEELIERCGGVKDIDNQLRMQSRQAMGGQGLGRQSSSVGGASGLTGSSGASESTTGSGRDVTGSGATGTSSTRKQ